MLGIKIYRILTFILLPIHILIGLFALLLLSLIFITGSFSNLLDVFIMSCSVIYIFASFIFLNKGIQQAKPIKASLKHLIQINAIVSIMFGIQIIGKVLFILFQPKIMQEFYKTALVTQQKYNGLKPPNIQILINGVLYSMLIYAVLLLAHLLFTFRFLQQYQHVFDDE